MNLFLYQFLLPFLALSTVAFLVTALLFYYRRSISMLSREQRAPHVESRRQKLLAQIGELRVLEQFENASPNAIAGVEKELILKYLEGIESNAELASARAGKSHQSSQMRTPASPAPAVLICYARQDNDNRDPQKRWVDRLQKHLEALQLQEQIAVFSDEEFENGDRWDEEIKAALATAKAVVLMVSPAFLASRYIRDREIPTILKRAHDKGVLVLPVVVRSCMYEETQFRYVDDKGSEQNLSLSVFQAANPLNQPLNDLKEVEQDKVLLDVAKRLHQWVTVVS